MSTRIVHNVLSMAAQRHIHGAQKNLDTAVERLSSGLRVNHAWDDPAALNLSERFRAQIASHKEAERNANYAINLISLVDGALSVIDEKLVRMRALSIQASNGPLSSSDRQALQLEFQSLRSEVDRIARSTNYNGKFLLDGTWSSENPNGVKFHIGIFNTRNVDYYYVQMGNATSNALGIQSLSLLNTATAQQAITTLDEAINSKDTLRTRLGAYVNRLQNTILYQQIARETSVAAEEALRDADIAEEMSNFTRAQVLMQSGISMLAQANMVPGMVAQLIG